MARKGELTPEEERFCRNVAVSGHLTASAMDAFGLGYSSGANKGSDLMKRPEVQKYIQKLKESDEADRRIQIDRLREENLRSIRDNLAAARKMNQAAQDATRELMGDDYGQPLDKRKTKYKGQEALMNAIARMGESSARIGKDARESLILFTGLEKLAEEILNGTRES